MLTCQKSRYNFDSFSLDGCLFLLYHLREERSVPLISQSGVTCFKNSCSAPGENRQSKALEQCLAKLSSPFSIGISYCLFHLEVPQKTDTKDSHPQLSQTPQLPARRGPGAGGGQATGTSLVPPPGPLPLHTTPLTPR